MLEQILDAVLERRGGGRAARAGALHGEKHDAFLVALEGDADEFFDAKDADTVAIIKDLIETRVRPAVAGDGGDITFKGYKEGVVFLTMKGACSGCPSSTATLQHGIQNLLKHFVPDVVEVRPV